MCAHAVHARCGGMVADKNSGVEARIEARHHTSMAGPRTHDANVLGKLLNEQALTVPVRITYHNLRCPRFFCGAHGSQRFIGHEVSKALVLKTARTQLVSGHHARNAFHVHRNVDLEFLCCRQDVLRIRRRTEEPGCQDHKNEGTSSAVRPPHQRTSRTYGLNVGEGESINFAPRKPREMPGQPRLRRESYSRECEPCPRHDEHTRPPASSLRECPAAALPQTRRGRVF